MGSRIQKVRKNEDGDITAVMLDNGKVYDIEEAVRMAKNGQIDGVIVGRAKNGREYLRSEPNDNPNDNLDNLPLM